MSANHLAQQFSPQRVFWLIRNRFPQDLVPLGIVAAIAAGINLLGIVFARTATLNDSSGFVWTMAIFFGSLILASGAFQEMHAGRSGTDWLLLPATAEEKYLAALLEYLLVLPLIAILGTMALSALSGLVAQLAGGSTGTIWTPFSPMTRIPELWGSFLVTVLLFLTGSARFRKRAFIKTAGAMMAWTTVVGLLMAFGLWVILNARGVVSHDGMGLHLNNMGMAWDGKDIPQNLLDAPNIVTRIFVFAVTPLAALAYGLCKVREKEAHDAVQ